MARQGGLRLTIMNPATFYLAAWLLLATAGACAAAPGCDEDFYSPETIRELISVGGPEALLMASFIARAEFVREMEPEDTLPGAADLREEALRLAPHDEMVLTFHANGCSPGNPSKDPLTCNLEGALRLANLDPDNGFYWANLAHYQLSEGLKKEALSSYQRAIRAPVFSIGWGRQVYRLTMTLKRALPATDSCASLLAAGLAATNLPAFQEFTRTCRAQLDEEPWRDACLNLGLKMETHSQAIVASQIGFALQRIVYEAEGDEKSMALVEARKARFEASIQKQSEIYSCRSEDPDWLQDWLVSIRDVGEVETLRWMLTTSPECAASDDTREGRQE